jgi:hypothetical protein
VVLALRGHAPVDGEVDELSRLTLEVDCIALIKEAWNKMKK